MGFQIRSIDFDGKKFVVPTDRSSSDRNAITVFIGKNGSGKSTLLSMLVECFYRLDIIGTGQSMELLQPSKSRLLNSEFKVTYAFNGEEETIKIYENTIKYTNTKAPRSVIAISTSPFDKFPDPGFVMSGKGMHSMHNYQRIGTRDNENKKIKDQILNLINKKNHEIRIAKVLNLFGLSSKITLKSKVNKDILSDARSSRSLKEALRIHLTRYIGRKDSDKSLESELFINEVFEEYKEYEEEIFITGAYSHSIDLASHTRQNKEFNLILEIAKLETIFFEPINKNEQLSLFSNTDRKHIEIDDLSSGQQCLLLIFLGIASYIENDSLICIDEPEISLHPEWQQIFIDLLSTTFNEYSGCHYLIATHSSHLFADTKYKNCSVIRLDDAETFSPSEYERHSNDFQLAKIFNTPGFKNEYLNRICVSILSRIAQEGSLSEELEDNLNFLKSIKDRLSKDDHILELIEIIEKALEIGNNE